MNNEEIKNKAKFDIDYYNKLALKYFERHDQPIQKYTTHLELQWLYNIVKPRSRILLVGVGGGRELPPLLDKNCQIVALDYSEGMLKAGIEKWGTHNVDWVLGDVHDLSQYHNSFDYVISLGALNYFVDIDLAMCNMANTLIPGGMLIVSSINALHRSERGLKRNTKFNRYTYSPNELKTIVTSKARLNVKEIRGFRYLIDSFPPKWNQSEASFLQKIFLTIGLNLEPIIRQVANPENAKFFWIIAEK